MRSNTLFIYTLYSRKAMVGELTVPAPITVTLKKEPLSNKGRKNRNQKNIFWIMVAFEQWPLSREDNHSLEFQGSLKLTLKFKVQSMSRWPVQKISRFFKVEGNWKISRGKWSWPWKTLNFKARTRVHISRELHIKARVEWFKISRNYQRISKNPWNPSE